MLLINLTGLPPQYWPGGINLPGGTNELGAIIAPFPILHPSDIILLCPIFTCSSIIEEPITQPAPITELSPMYIEFGTPVGVVYHVCKIQLSPIVT